MQLYNLYSIVERNAVEVGRVRMNARADRLEACQVMLNKLTPHPRRRLLIVPHDDTVERRDLYEVLEFCNFEGCDQEPTHGMYCEGCAMQERKWRAEELAMRSPAL